MKLKADAILCIQEIAVLGFILVVLAPLVALIVTINRFISD